MTYEQWEEARKVMWDSLYDEYEGQGEDPSECAGFADAEILDWERRYPRPERTLSATFQEAFKVATSRVSAPDRIGCQNLTYTKEGVRLSNGELCRLQGIKTLRKYVGFAPDGANFYGVCGYNGTYHNGYILIGGQRVTTAQLDAMIARCEKLAREPEVDLSKWWKCVLLSGDRGLRFVNNPDNYFGFNAQPQHPKEGFATKEEAEKFASSRRHTSRSEIAVMPYLATKLPEKRWQVWYKGDTNQAGWLAPRKWTYDNKEFKTQEAAKQEITRQLTHFRTFMYEIREVEVYPND